MLKEKVKAIIYFLKLLDCLHNYRAKIHIQTAVILQTNTTSEVN